MKVYNKSKKKKLLIIGGSSSLGKDIIDKFISKDWYVIATYNFNKLNPQKNLTTKN